MGISTTRRDWMKTAAVASVCLAAGGSARALPRAKTSGRVVRPSSNENPHGPSNAARRAAYLLAVARRADPELELTQRVRSTA